ncbi:hypothetical protein NA56DRAFT_63852 [Hyaloscypha hepaticicola]|uniref:Uncharacterized protein n=1 Tax=Hyaloscypha hepaticicola TaxID=2082293 RepID=A0A2J6QAE1_9HELO|nr:hypothetical protein NA56DRAFT_63852 [Hyaloscypha hepaticicola]
MEREEKATLPSPMDLNNSAKKVHTPPSPIETDKSSSCTTLTHEPKRPGETAESAPANPPLSMAFTSHGAPTPEEICPSESRSDTHSLALSEDNSKHQAASQHQLQGWVYETRNSIVDMPERLVKLDWENQGRKP